METNFQGDLADIFRPGSTVNSGDPPGVSHQWNYLDDQETTIHDQGFGQPFTSLLGDPLIIDHDLGLEESVATRLPPMEFDDHNHNQNDNIFSKMLQILPTVSSSNSEIITSSSNSSSSKKQRCLPEASTSSLQISSPRKPGIKRRKNQTKKVVCIPASTPVNTRSTGEVVPSDLWAWRKYGQKPIKGSPYPRGYYRCSSSKSCLARKQVERSRTDSNMLVITYTSEHNHPWPTQRNALAGSTRTPQQPKTTTTAEQPPQKETIKEEGPTIVGDIVVQVKDELQVLEANFPQGYRPESLPEHRRGGGGQPEDYFYGLGEIGVDSISMLLNNGFLGGDEEAQSYNKDLDPFG